MCLLQLPILDEAKEKEEVREVGVVGSVKPQIPHLKAVFVVRK